MIRYHLGLDGSAGPRGKRMRPLLGLLAYASIAGEHARALPGAAAVELGHNFSLVHDDIEDGDVERRHRATLWALHGVPQAINTGDLIFSLSRVALHRLTDLGFSDAKVLRLMRLYDETCVMLCEGQYIDIATSASDEPMTVELYFDMIGRKTAALISASIEAGALLATDDEDVIAGYRRFGWALGPRLPAQRRPARHLGPGADDRQGADGRRPPQEDPAGHVRVPARGSGGPRPSRGALRAARARRRARSPRSSAILERSGARDFTRAEAQRYRDECLAELDALDGRGARRPARSSRASSSASSAPRAPARRRRSPAVGPQPPAAARYSSPSAADSSVTGRSRTTSTLPTRRPSVVSTVRRRPSTRISSPGVGTPPMRWYTRPPTVSYSSSSSSGTLDVPDVEQVLDGGAPVDAGPVLVEHLDERLLLVVLVLDLADDLLEEVLDRHQARRAAVLVEHDRDVDLAPLELVEQVVDRHRLRHEHRRPQQRPQARPRRPRRT